MSVSAYLFVNPWFDQDENWAALHVSGTPLSDSWLLQLQTLRQQVESTSLARRLPWVVHDPVDGDPAPPAGGTGADLLVVEPSISPERRDRLRQLGWKIAWPQNPGSPPPAGSADFLLCEGAALRNLSSRQRQLLQTDTALVAVRNGSKEVFEAVRGDCVLASSEFLFAYDNAGRKPDMTRVRLLKLLALIAQDADTCEIEEIFRHEPKLSYSLMRLVNSPAVSPHAHLTSFGQAITLLGRRHLQRWLQLLIYADHHNGSEVNPLLLHAAARGRLLELIAPTVPGLANIPDLAAAAFMTGIFSLLDLLLGLPMPEVLAQLPLPDSVSRPLARRETALGSLLNAIESADLERPDEAGAQLQQLGIDPATFLTCQLEALAWADQIGYAASGN